MLGPSLRMKKKYEYHLSGESGDCFDFAAAFIVDGMTDFVKG